MYLPTLKQTPLHVIASATDVFFWTDTGDIGDTVSMKCFAARCSECSMHLLDEVREECDDCDEERRETEETQTDYKRKKDGDMLHKGRKVGERSKGTRK